MKSRLPFSFAVLLLLAAECLAASPTESAATTRSTCCGELYVLVNPAGKAPKTAAERALFQDLREWGEVVAARERLRQAEQAGNDPNYDPFKMDLSNILATTMFHAEGDSWDELRTASVQLRQLLESSPRDPESTRKTVDHLRQLARKLESPTYARIQAYGAVSSDDEQKETMAEVDFLKRAALALKDAFHDGVPLTPAERKLIRAMRQFEGKRLSPRRTAFWINGLREGIE